MHCTGPWTNAEPYIQAGTRIAGSRFSSPSYYLNYLRCTSKSLNISLLTFGIVYIGYHFSSVSLLIYRCLHQAAPSYLAEMCVPVSATDNQCQLRSATHGDLAVPWVRLARYGSKSFSVSDPLLCNSLRNSLLRAPWLSVMYHWHWLSPVHDWRLFCCPEPTGHHHRASVTVSAVKFVCTNKNLLTYLLIHW